MAGDISDMLDGEQAMYYGRSPDRDNVPNRQIVETYLNGLWLDAYIFMTADTLLKLSCALDDLDKRGYPVDRYRRNCGILFDIYDGGLT